MWQESISSELLMRGGRVRSILLSAVVENSSFSMGVLKYVVCLCKGVMYVVFYVCIVTCGAVGDRV